MILKKEILEKAKNFLGKKGSFSYRVCKILINGEFDRALSSSELTELLNEGPGKKIKVNQLAAFMESLLREEIVRVANVNDKKFWFPAWLSKEEVKKLSNLNSTFNLEEFLDNKSLYGACKSAFNSKEYWNACLHAFRHLETKIREKCRLPATELGTDLINKAFHPTSGILKIPCCATVPEEEGFQLINRGIVLFHRNVKGHREGKIGMRDALKIIGYMDYILNMLATAKKRRSR